MVTIINETFWLRKFILKKYGNNNICCFDDARRELFKNVNNLT